MHFVRPFANAPRQSTLSISSLASFYPSNPRFPTVQCLHGRERTHCVDKLSREPSPTTPKRSRTEPYQAFTYQRRSQIQNTDLRYYTYLGNSLHTMVVDYSTTHTRYRPLLSFSAPKRRLLIDARRPNIGQASGTAVLLRSCLPSQPAPNPYETKRTGELR